MVSKDKDMEKTFDTVKPIHKEAYEAYRHHTSGYTFPGYVAQVVALVEERKLDYTESQIRNVIRGNKRSWTLLNIIREVLELPLIEFPIQLNKEKLIKDLRLQKTA